MTHPTNMTERMREEFDRKFPLVECSAHERTSSAFCICDDLGDINDEAKSIRNWIFSTYTAALRDEAMQIIEGARWGRVTTKLELEHNRELDAIIEALSSLFGDSKEPN